jgi:hypothetical protein
VIDGDPATDPKQFYGLNARLTGNQVISAGTNGGPSRWPWWTRLLDAVVGTNSQKVHRLQQGDPAEDHGAGRRRRRRGRRAGRRQAGHGVQRRPIEVIDEDGDEAAILGFDETQGNSAPSPARSTASAPAPTPTASTCRAWWGARWSSTSTTASAAASYEDLVEALMGLAVFHPRAAARLKGVLPRS